MSAPSLLADNPSARIEIVQGGGGMGGIMVGGDPPGFTESELKILTQYGLQPGGRLDTEILPEIKKQFLEQLSKSNCAIGTGDNIILNSECSAVAQVIGAMIRSSMKRTNGWTPKSLKVAAKPPAAPGLAPSPVAPPPVPGRRIDTSALLATIRARINSPHAGLKNCGNTCYLNSVLQMLSYVPEFVDESSKNAALYSIFRDLYSTTGFVNLQANKRLDTVFGGIFDVIRTQQDAADFIIKLNTKYSITSPYFNITQVVTTTCTHAPPPDLGLPERTPARTTIPHILLDINNGNSIEDLLNYSYRPVPIDDIENCITPGNDVLRGPGSQITSYEIPDENRYVVISLLRFRDTGRRDSNNKIIYDKLNKHIQITPEIRLGGVEYSLYGVILHTGTLNGGHYRFLKVKEDLVSGIMYNDSSVTEIPNTADMNQNTYIAIYRRDNIPAAAPEAPAAAPEAPAAAPEAPAAAPEAPAAAPEAPAASPAVVGAMPNLRASTMEAEPEVNLNAPVSNENAPRIIEEMVDILMQVEPRQRKIMARDDINTKVTSTLEAINSLPDGTPPGLTRDDITPSGVIKTDRINYIVRNFRNYSKTDLRGVVSLVRGLCLTAIKDGGILNSGDDARIRRTLTIVEELLRELEILKYNINQHIRMSAAAPEASAAAPATASPAAPATGSPAAANVNYPDEFYEENPSNFQPGHLRINFNKPGHNAPGNRRVYANTTVGTRRTRIYGTNAANIKKKYDARTRKLKAAANRAASAAAAAARVASETRSAAAKAKNSREAAARAAAEAKRTLKSMEAKAAKNAAAEAKAAIRAKIAAGEPVSFMNRMRAKFGGRRTRRKTRGSRKSRRGGRK